MPTLHIFRRLLYAELTRELDAPLYERIDAPATQEKAVLVELSPALGASELAGHPIEAVLRRARGLATSLAKMNLRRTFEELAPACPRV
jgi:phosphoglucomutase